MELPISKQGQGQGSCTESTFWFLFCYEINTLLSLPFRSTLKDVFGFYGEVTLEGSQGQLGHTLINLLADVWYFVPLPSPHFV